MGKVISMSGLCVTEGCAKAVHARGYCRGHYMKLREAGALRMNSEVIAEHGRKADHPFYLRWSRRNSAGNLAPEWSDFWRFVADVGDSNGCTKMLRKDRAKPMGPDNFYWAEKLTGERKNAYYRDWYKTKPAGREGRYQKAYGISLAEYEAMSEAQGHVCAICGEPEKIIVRSGTNEDTRRLSVDHDHATGAVRGLLCGDCNVALGAMKDSRESFLAAVAYLDQHEAEGEKAA